MSADATLSGSELFEAIRAAADYLLQSASAIDAINIYPVPDNDTGSNMAKTLDEACDYVIKTKQLEEDTVSEVLQRLSRGALHAGKGNSGVILAQALLGLAEGTGKTERLDGRLLARCLRAAATAAYTAVAKPVEGTMLTVLRAAAEGAEQQQDKRSVLIVLESALEVAEQARVATTVQLPALCGTGLTDAGGEGICAILRGLTAFLRNECPTPVVTVARRGKTQSQYSPDESGYCITFTLLAGKPTVDINGIRQHLSAHRFRSVIITGDKQALRVHVHTDEPEGLLKEVESFGKLVNSQFEKLKS